MIMVSNYIRDTLRDESFRECFLLFWHPRSVAQNTVLSWDLLFVF